MRTLVLWDDAEQIELLQMYLNVDEAVVSTTLDPEAFLAAVRSEDPWDVILMTTTHPDPDHAFRLFQEVEEQRPGTPIVGACHSEGVYRIAQFLTAGLRSYVIRDVQGDYLFLLHAMLEGAVRQVSAEREKQISQQLRREIESVRKLQESIIPQSISSPDGYQITARYESSQIRVFGGQPVTLAGGDYYDAFSLTGDNIVVLVGDASGHGMKACMSIMTMHTLIRMIRENDFRDPARFVTLVNRQIFNQRIVNEDGGFITLLYGVLDIATHTFKWCSAGHPVPLLQDLETGAVTAVGTEEDPGLPLGIMDEVEYETRTLTLPSHCRLALFSDGLIEAFGDSATNQFGNHGVSGSMTRTRSRPLDECLECLFHDSNAFTKGIGRHDDTSILLVQRDAR